MKDQSKDLLAKLRKSNKVKESDILSDSKFFKNLECVVTSIPALNIACSAQVDGGFSSGIMQIAGESRHFKTLFMLIMMAEYLKKYPDAIMIFYDSEFGAALKYFKSVGIDSSRVLHKPIENMEELKFDIISTLSDLQRGDKVIIGVDSIGNLASKKELDDAHDGKSTADMTRAKQMKSIFRMVTPMVRKRDIPFIAVNHTYNTQEMFAKQIVSGGQGPLLSSQDVWIITRSQLKNESQKEKLVGYTFNINIEKSRTVREKRKIPIEVTFNEGVNKYSGILTIATNLGFIVTPSKGWRCLCDPETGEIFDNEKFQEKDARPFLKRLVEDQKFKDAVVNYYALNDDERLLIEEEEQEELSKVVEEDLIAEDEDLAKLKDSNLAPS